MKVCPKCKYERTIQDDLLYPDYECPSCGIILEKDKAKKILAALEKEREEERKSKREKFKKEKEQKRRAEEDRKRKEDEARQLQAEEAFRKKEEEERIQREKEEQLRQEEERRRKEKKARQRQEDEALRKMLEEERVKGEEEERLRQEEEVRKHKEEEARLRQAEEGRRKKEEEERLQREKEEQLRKEQEEERERKKEEEKKRKVEQERIKKEDEAKRLLQTRQEKISNLARKNADKIIASEEDTDKYQLFDMCPFVMAQTGKGLAIAGIGDKKNKWQHLRCIQKYCRLWTLKIDGDGEVYARGCAMQFQGLTNEEIVKNFEIKNRQIIEAAYPLNEETGDTETGE